MGRNTLAEFNTRFSRGLNQQPNYANLEECADCLNVYAPDGELQNRPGHEGIRYLDFLTAVTQNAAETNSNVFEDVGGVIKKYDVGTDSYTYTETDSSNSSVPFIGLTVGDWIYFGADGNNFSLDGGSVSTGGLFYLWGSIAGDDIYNTGTGFPVMQYWNGTRWASMSFLAGLGPSNNFGIGNAYVGRYLFAQPATRSDVAGSLSSSLFTKSMVMSLVEPEDWALTTVDSVSKYWYRLGILDGTFNASNDPDVLARVVMDDLNALTNRFTSVFSVDLPEYTKYVYLTYLANSSSIYGTVSRDLIVQEGIRTELTGAGSIAYKPTSLNIGETREMFIATGHRVYTVAADSQTFAVMTLDTSDASTGVGAPFDSTRLALEATVPQANLIAVHKNKIWYAGIKGDKRLVRWGAPVPYHRVLPQLGFERVGEGSGDPITALYSFGEHIIVADQHKMWKMVFSGLDEFEVDHYVPIDLPNAVGCRANGSIATCENRMVFLSSNGIYYYDGISVQKATLAKRKGIEFDRLENFWRRISTGRLEYAAGVNWKEKGLYLLSLSVDGSEYNNMVVVWDYINDTWWLWNNINAESFFFDKERRLCFVKANGALHRFTETPKDHGGKINAFVESQRINQSRFKTLRLREVEVLGNNRVDSLVVETTANDSGTTKSMTLDYTENLENDMTDAGITGTAPVSIVPDTPRERKRTAYVKMTGESFKVKISNNVKGVPMLVRSVGIRGVGIGLRSTK